MATETTETTAGPTGFNAAEIADLSALGAKVEDTIESLEKYLKDHDIYAEWNETIDAIRAETGFEFNYHTSPYYNERWNYDLTLSANGIEFDALDHDNERVGFFIPFTFLSPQTREQCIEDLRTKYAAQAARQAEEKRAKMQTKREQAERALAKAQADLAALDEA